MIEVKRVFSNLSSKEYNKIRLFCESQAIDLGVLDGLIEEVVFDRWNLALSFTRCVCGLSTEVKDNLRTIISRNYYACYQAARAFVLFVTRSDIDDHKKLAKILEDCLEPVNAGCAKILEKWRDLRNEADYSPYPFIDDLKITAEESYIETTEFLEILKQEFRKRGLIINATE